MTQTYIGIDSPRRSRRYAVWAGAVVSAVLFCTLCSALTFWLMAPRVVQFDMKGTVDLFNQQDEAYRDSILPDVPSSQILRVSIEAGVTQGWERFTGLKGLNIGLDRFGASAPAEVLFERFGFTADAIVSKILEKIEA